MSSGRKTGFGNVRSFIGNSMGGLTGKANLAAWAVAGTLAYFLWVKPSQQLRKDQKEKSRAAATDPNRYIQKRKPIPGRQETGLIYGNKSEGNNSKDIE